MLSPMTSPIAKARQRKGWSQYRLAVAADVHPNTISLAERTGHLSEGVAKRVAAALGVQVATLRERG